MVACVVAVAMFFGSVSVAVNLAATESSTRFVRERQKQKGSDISELMSNQLLLAVRYENPKGGLICFRRTE